jgi:dTDP-4-dehydrorhamnose reductase
VILVTGASGQVGRALRRLLGDDGAYPAREELDLTDVAGVQPALSAFAPDVLINCAAYTDVERAEDEEEAAFVVNALAVQEMAVYARGAGIPFVTYSTDYVFDGSSDRPYVERDLPGPLNAYGRTKLAGEQLALETYPGTLLIRSSWVISGSRQSFVSKILHKARDGPIQVVDDQIGCPTVASDLAVSSLGALDRGVSGILHLASSESASWFDLARAALNLAGLDSDGARPCSTNEFPTVARRPPYSVLGSERLESEGLAPMPDWSISLPAAVEEIMR